MSTPRLTYKPMLVVFTGVMALVSMAINAMTWTWVKTSIDDAVAAQTDRDLWERLVITLMDAETGQRGYVITGDKTFLEPFDRANLAIGQNLSALKAGTGSDSAALAEFSMIEAKVLKKLDAMKVSVVVREREGFAAAAALVESGEGKALMDSLRASIGEKVKEKQGRSLTRSTRIGRDLRWGYASALGAGVIALGSGGVAFLLLRDALQHARREQQFKQEKQRAENADREKSVFLATMSHEIRTPMNAILGFAELLHDRLDDERELKYVDSILTGGRSLLQLINDILDLSKVEAGMLELHPEPTDLRAAARFIQQLFAHLCSQRGIDLRLQIDDEIPSSLLFDSLRLRQILINVVGNAIKFTREGEVTLRIHGYPDVTDRSHIRIVVEVEDTGRGIPQDQLESIFKPFVQVGDTGEKIGVPGTGLGLAIVQRLTRLMDGKVSVESEVGRGTLFRFDFPGVEVSSRIADSIMGIEEDSIDFDNFRPSIILVADDNPTNLELLSGIFEGTSHKVLLASDGESAVAKAMEETPDLVLMDVRMPKKDGLEALEDIRAEERLRLLPVIAVTASSLGSDDARARRKFDGYIRKPFSRSELYQQMAQFIPTIMADAPHREPAAETVEAPGSPEAAAQWLRLAEVLDEAATEEYPLLLRTMSVSEIERFAQRLRSLATEASCGPIGRYATTLEADAGSFSPDLMERTLKQFPGLVARIRSAAAS